jgi:hypothetical protein
MRLLRAVAALILALGAGNASAQDDVRPEPPQRPGAQATEADCQVPERRDRLIADPEAFIAAASAYGLELNRHSERLMEWRSRKFREAGRWTADDETEFGMALIQDAAFIEEMAASMNLAMDVLAPLTRFSEQGRAPEDQCRDLIETQGLFDRLTSSVERQWRMIDQAYAAEAARFGIALD